ncbi:hypothetical protein GCM10027442_35690 [Emticicia fontis]
MDPHMNNKDLLRTQNLINQYQSIRKSLNFPKTGFFSTDIKSLRSVSNSDSITDGFVFDLTGEADEKRSSNNENTFGKYINYGSLRNSPNQDFIDMLFSEDNIKIDLEIGFVGNPNIGSVVLNQFRNSKEFIAFSSSVTKNDRVFIISSIFGGTGAAGFPIILKNIKQANLSDNPNLQNRDLLPQLKVGALTVMPYFGIFPDGNSPANASIKKADFIAKTKAALSYYSNVINSDVDRLYYICDEVMEDLKHDSGKDGQQNPAHFVELASALSIIDFIQASDIVNDNTKFREFSIKENSNELNFTNLFSKTREIVAIPLSKMMFVYRFLTNKEGLISFRNKKASWIVDEKLPITDVFLKETSSFYGEQLMPFIKGFNDWLKEMAAEDTEERVNKVNIRKFKPFELDEAIEPKLTIVKYPSANVGVVLKTPIDFNTFNTEINELHKSNNFLSTEIKFVTLLDKATDNLLSKYYPSLSK